MRNRPKSPRLRKPSYAEPMAPRWVYATQEGGARCLVHSFLYLTAIYRKLPGLSIALVSRDKSQWEKSKAPISWRMPRNFDFFPIFEYFYFGLSGGPGLD